MFQKKFEFSDHSGPVYCLSGVGHFLFSSGADKFVVRWDLENFKQDNFVIRLEQSAYSILHLKNLPYLVVGCSNGDLHIINSDLRQEIKFIQHHKTAIFSIYEISDKNLLITGDSEGNICIWETNYFHLLIQVPLDSGKIRSIYHIKNELIIGSKDGVLRFFELDFFNQIHEIKINKDGIQSILKIDDVLESNTKKIISKIPAHKGPIYSLIKINDTKFLSASRDKSIKIWDSKTLKVIDKKEFKTGGHKNSVNQMLGLDNNTFASCSDDSRIVLWSSK
jgi:WD40 repeat protein